MPKYPIRPHHQCAIDRIIEHFAPQEEVVGVIVGGSVAKGRARDDSDVDIHIVLTEEAAQERHAKGDIFFYAPNLCEYTGGYVDGKFISMSFMKEVGEKGSEPARAAFEDAFLVLDRHPDLARLLQQACRYPEENRERNIRDFLSQIALYGGFFMREAEKRDDPYLRIHAASELALFGCRLVLAYNRRLYPYHKWLMWAVAKAEQKPEGFDESLRNLLQTPSADHASDFAQRLQNFREWKTEYGDLVSRFIELREWNWIHHEPPVHDQ